MNIEEAKCSLIKEIEHDLMVVYGPLIFGEKLISVLGFRNKRSFQTAVKKGTIPVLLFELDHQRGKYAFTKDIATWLAELRMAYYPLEVTK